MIPVYLPIWPITLQSLNDAHEKERISHITYKQWLIILDFKEDKAYYIDCREKMFLIFYNSSIIKSRLYVK